MKKKTSLKQAKVKAWNAFSKYIRLRDCLKTTGEYETGQCCTCGKIYFYHELHAGHFRDGRKSSTLFEETNVHIQCPECNIFKHGNKVQYTEFMLQKYGQDEISRLIELDHQIKKYIITEYQEIEKKYKQKYEELIYDKLPEFTGF